MAQLLWEIHNDLFISLLDYKACTRTIKILISNTYSCENWKVSNYPLWRSMTQENLETSNSQAPSWSSLRHCCWLCNAGLPFYIQISNGISILKCIYSASPSISRFELMCCFSAWSPQFLIKYWWCRPSSKYKYQG